MKQFNATIRDNRSIASGFHAMAFSWEAGTPPPLPGQFFTVRVSDTTAPLLRRPFAFSSFDAATGTASFIYQKRGVSTEILAGMTPGETIDIIAPFGNTFSMQKTGTAIILAGGIGLGPMIFLAAALKNQGLPVKFVFGCRSKDFIPPQAVFGSTDPVLCTDDGSVGFKGTVIDHLNSLDKSDLIGGTVYACGPHVMLHAAHTFAEKYALACEVSMEQTMACGVGACMGCVVPVNKEPGFLRVCKDGPIFESTVIKWN